ncbi:3-hydroxyacyl-ACP dehydratase FabZ [Meiothermus ruber]|uniref:3-hydroxyacyl-[acyl-carrier-protein] dehydratase FabZ n=1 Tax=Meiothermus ruber (strain ATCC 35948 / DSM 1279 / VKM B-1258 / 21) TaxID=504728 RepID=D3PNW7_MEIRD|nr:3-hydroxyacyl-ACP dehydratase FabZ [Meiothermus ruber]ADD29512.1 beta-hydroxyacyl-(acyl-carrier-protein) dehydratase FabZ [Meiothermus ruber DSM 1279]AGK05035.1 3-hydroxyacyl-ACP dehydratase [Meiothermus ruber DSM 1279]MCL6529279.1 3-hydroxyacyl-ACP dehydratase FabZ [Meiothermus ruber]MCX7802124.1 3-hydroxyacyl-ACP dehydratase FabZ [Meiothermus ruber]GAO76435.1 3-hydroxyacyl-ACP dehydratase [Meiothermus ruber H328]
MDIYEILKFLPHRYPFLLIDRVLEADEKRFRALKNVSFNEPHFQGHFPGYPIMPGVLLIEAMAQGSVAVVTKQPEFKPGGLVFLVGVEEARFKKPVVPGDTLILEGELLAYRRGLGKVKVEARVEGELRAEATLSFVLRSDTGGAAS